MQTPHRQSGSAGALGRPVEVALIPEGMLKFHVMKQAKLHHIIPDTDSVLGIESYLLLDHPSDSLVPDKALTIGTKVIFPADQNIW